MMRTLIKKGLISMALVHTVQDEKGETVDRSSGNGMHTIEWFCIGRNRM